MQHTISFRQPASLGFVSHPHLAKAVLKIMPKVRQTSFFRQVVAVKAISVNTIHVIMREITYSGEFNERVIVTCRAPKGTKVTATVEYDYDFPLAGEV